MHIPSLVKIHRSLLKLSSGNDGQRYGHVSGRLTRQNWRNSPISNPKPDLHNINAHTTFGENPLMFTQVIIRKQKQTDDRWMDRLTNNQRENIIPCHYCVAGYKKRSCSYSSFPHYFIYISNFRSQITYSFVKWGCSIYCFPHFRNSDISRYGYLEVFLRVPCNSR